MQRASNPTAGVLWMVLTGLCFVMVTAIVKHVGAAVPAAEAAFLRYAMGLVFLLPVLGQLRAARLSRRQIGLFAGRGLLHSLGVILWFFAMTRISIAEVTAMGYMNPLYVTVAAALLFGEALPPRRIAAVCVALLGALVILRPGMRALDIGHVAMLFNSLFFAGSYLIAKWVTDDVSPAVVVAILSVTVTIGLAPFTLANWVTPGMQDLGWLFGVACFATAGHYSMTRAFACAPLTVTQPVTFIQLVWATLLGAVVFGEAVDGWVILGGAMVLGSVSFITWREARARRRVTPAVPQTKG